MWLFALALLSQSSIVTADPPAGPPCVGEKVAVLPLLPVAASPGVARGEEERLRDELAATKGLCVQPRADTLRLLGNATPIACDDVVCRSRLADRVAADWVIWGTVFGFGGKTSVASVLWSGNGERVARRTYEPSPDVRVTDQLLMSAKATPIGAVPPEPIVHGNAVPLAIAGIGIVALGAGAAYGFTSLESARRIGAGQTGCQGTYAAYTSCLDAKVRTGQTQTTTANWLFGTAAVLGVSAGILWVTKWP